MSAITSIKKPILIDQLTMINEIMKNFTNCINNNEEIEFFLQLEKSEGIIELEISFNILETNIKLLQIGEDEPSRYDMYEDITHWIGSIFSNIDRMKTIYAEYNDYPIREIYILKDIKKDINDVEFNDLVIKRLNEKKERDFTLCLRNINVCRIEILKLLIFIKEVLNKIISRGSGYERFLSDF